jgi:hypothetical protein
VTVAAPPDLSTEEGRAAWRDELRRVAFWPRMAGIGLIFGSGGVILWNRFVAHAANSVLTNAAFVTLALGWALFLVAFVMRNRYQRRRLSDQ